LFAPIIERNTIVPASRERTFSTISDGQRVVRMSVYQGESRKVSDNVHLGEIDVPVPHGKAGDVAVTCRFTYDINGILEVDLHVPSTGERRELVIVDDPNAVSPEELEQRRKVLTALKIHPREEQLNVAVLARLDRCYEQSLGERREQIGRWISSFTALVEGQNPRAIADARTRLVQAMDSIEGESFL
jgi:molecular chaperone HscC